jgi:hypothetical protein
MQGVAQVHPPLFPRGLAIKARPAAFDRLCECISSAQADDREQQVSFHGFQE